MLLALRFASGSAPAVHITSGEVINIGRVSITNSMIYAWICSIIIVCSLIVVAKMVRIRPRRGLIQIVEAISEYIMKLIETNVGSHKKAIKYAPYFVSIFFFILLTNWLGLLPVVGEAFKVNQTPLFRPFTADLNGTLAAAVISICLVQYFAIKESGFSGHMRHYFAGNLLNPLTYLYGLLEIFTELTRVASLSLRLFLNIAVGEIIISVFAYLGNFAAPLTALPVTFFELFVGALQAYIFTLLCIVYLSLAINRGDEHDRGDVQFGSQNLTKIV